MPRLRHTSRSGAAVRSARWNRFCTQTISVPATACCSCSRLAFDREIRTVICTTNAIESINARLRRGVNARSHFPAEQAALKCLYLAIMSLDPTGKGRQRWTSPSRGIAAAGRCG
jgi:transposase-like protein